MVWIFIRYTLYRVDTFFRFDQLLSSLGVDVSAVAGNSIGMAMYGDVCMEMYRVAGMNLYDHVSTLYSVLSTLVPYLCIGTDLSHHRLGYGIVQISTANYHHFSSLH